MAGLAHALRGGIWKRHRRSQKYWICGCLEILGSKKFRTSSETYSFLCWPKRSLTANAVIACRIRRPRGGFETIPRRTAQRRSGCFQRSNRRSNGMKHAVRLLVAAFVYASRSMCAETMTVREYSERWPLLRGRLSSSAGTGGSSDSGRIELGSARRITERCGGLMQLMRKPQQDSG